MRTLRIYRHPNCERCRAISELHKMMDWLDRLEFSTEVPPCGALRMGEIAVEELASGAIFKGAAAVRSIFRQVPAYWLFYPLLCLPIVAKRIDRDLSGCDDVMCKI